MIINELIKASVKPEIYKKGNSFMWTDSHISKQLLQIHLNKDIDLASRKESSITSTVDWILSRAPRQPLNILDLGCGPGLYSQQLAENGHKVTGIDISCESINYAVRNAVKNKADITYMQGNYLETDFSRSEFDLVIMIYTDFGVLLPDERNLLLKKVKKALKPGGLFIFDVLNDLSFSEKRSERTWDSEISGFWAGSPYLHFSNSHIYPDDKVILYQHLVFDESEKYKTYYFWTHFFSDDDLVSLMTENNFKIISFNNDVLIPTDQFDGENVTFVVSGII